MEIRDRKATMGNAWCASKRILTVDWRLKHGSGRFNGLAQRMCCTAALSVTSLCLLRGQWEPLKGKMTPSRRCWETWEDKGGNATDLLYLLQWSSASSQRAWGDGLREDGNDNLRVCRVQRRHSQTKLADCFSIAVLPDSRITGPLSTLVHIAHDDLSSFN